MSSSEKLVNSSMAGRYWRLPRARWEWIALALGIALLCYTLPILYFGIVSRGWGTTEGTVTYSQSRETRRRSDVDIRYTYAVRGHQYSGERWRYDLAINSTRSIEVSATQAAYPVGSHPPVWVDPDNPARSVLEPGPDWAALIWIGAAFMFVAGSGMPGRAERTSMTASSAVDAASPQPARPRHGFAQVMAGIGIVILGVGLLRIYGVMQGAAWPTVEGRVLYSNTAGTGSDSVRQAEIRYEYYFAGRRHTGSASWRAGRDETRALAASHRVGQAVTVHYDPSNPSRSAIVTDLNWHYAVLPAIAVIFLLLAALAKAATRSSSGRAR